MYELIETNNYNEDNLIIDYFDRNIYLYLSNKINKDKTFSSSLVEGKKPKKVTNLVNTNPVIINSYLEDKILSLEILNQQVIIYLYIFNYSYEDVSNILNLSINEIKKIEKLSLKYLKEIIESEKINLVVSK
jgi:DNA-directed RNA polymerase sigma subunit (sigma70/sigma32)